MRRDGLKNGVLGFRQRVFAHEEHVQAASLRAKLLRNRGKEFIVFGKLCCYSMFWDL